MVQSQNTQEQDLRDLREEAARSALLSSDVAASRQAILNRTPSKTQTSSTTPSPRLLSSDELRSLPSRSREEVASLLEAQALQADALMRDAIARKDFKDRDRFYDIAASSRQQASVVRQGSGQISSSENVLIAKARFPDKRLPDLEAKYGYGSGQVRAAAGTKKKEAVTASGLSIKEFSALPKTDRDTIISTYQKEGRVAARELGIEVEKQNFERGRTLQEGVQSTQDGRQLVVVKGTKATTAGNYVRQLEGKGFNPGRLSGNTIDSSFVRYKKDNSPEVSSVSSVLIENIVNPDDKKKSSERLEKFELQVKAQKKREEEFFSSEGFSNIREIAKLTRSNSNDIPRLSMNIPFGEKNPSFDLDFANKVNEEITFGLLAAPIAVGGLIPIALEKSFLTFKALTIPETRKNVLPELKRAGVGTIKSFDPKTPEGFAAVVTTGLVVSPYALGQGITSAKVGVRTTEVPKGGKVDVEILSRQEGSSTGGLSPQVSPKVQTDLFFKENVVGIQKFTRGKVADVRVRTSSDGSLTKSSVVGKSRFEIVQGAKGKATLSEFKDNTLISKKEVPRLKDDSVQLNTEVISREVTRQDVAQPSPETIFQARGEVSNVNVYGSSQKFNAQGVLVQESASRSVTSAAPAESVSGVVLLEASYPKGLLLVGDALGQKQKIPSTLKLSKDEYALRYEDNVISTNLLDLKKPLSKSSDGLRKSFELKQFLINRGEVRSGFEFETSTFGEVNIVPRSYVAEKGKAISEVTSAAFRSRRGQFTEQIVKPKNEFFIEELKLPKNDSYSINLPRSSARSSRLATSSLSRSSLLNSEKNSFISDLKDDSLVDSESLLDIKPAQDIRSDTDIAQKSVQKLEPVQEVKQELENETLLRNKGFFAQDNTVKLSLRLPKPKVNVPLIKFSDSKNTSSDNNNILQVRRRGKFQTVAQGLSFDEATKQGAVITSTTAAASFRVLGAQKDSSRGFGALTRQFGRSKKEQGVFVEKNKFRIDSVGELGEITRKGQLRKKKKKSKRSLWV